MTAGERTWTWEWWFDAPPARVWPFASDTDRIDRIAGLPPATYSPSASTEGALDVRQTLLGLFPLAYEETPFEWVEGERWEVLRVFSKGPVARLRIRTELRSDGRGTRVAMRLDATPRGWFSSLLLPMVMRRSHRGLDRAFADVERRLVPASEDRPARRAVLRKALARFSTVPGVPRDLATALATHVASADAGDLRRLRPFALADAWGLPRRDLLAATLLGVRAGVFELSWESLCPHCRGGKRPVRSLADVSSRAHCEACAIDFDVEFDRSLEAVFRPASDLRRVASETYCLAGPSRTPHVVAQLRVDAGGEAWAEVPLEPGAYRVRLARRPAPATVRAEDAEGAAGDLEVEVEDGSPRIAAETVRTGHVPVRIANRGSRGALALLERVRWLDDVATAMDVVAVPGFPDLFAQEVLARNERIAVGRVAILFTDLRGSTALYRGIGDAAAYAVVREHFGVLRRAIARHGGVLVKTIGDAVMGAFRSAADALSAALDVHRDLAALPVPAGAERLVLKAGVHCGPSIVVNASDRIDYFGTTTNLAARAQYESAGDDVVVTDAVLADEDARRLLDSLPHRRSSFRAPLKGFEGDVLLHRIEISAAAISRPGPEPEKR